MLIKMLMPLRRNEIKYTQKYNKEWTDMKHVEEKQHHLKGLLLPP